MTFRMLWLGFALGFVFSTAAEAAAPAAVLLEMTGRCEVAAGSGPYQPARPGMGLSLGDRLAVRDGQAKLLRSNGRVETIEAGHAVRIEASGRPAQVRGALGRLWEILRGRIGTATGENALLSDAGAVRALPGRRIDLVSPRNTALAAAPARVEWVKHPDVLTYRVRITDGNGSVLWSATTSSTAADVGALGLKPATYYFVRVSDIRRGGPASDEAFFRVLTPAQLEQARGEASEVRRLAPAGASGALLEGSVYLGWNLLEEAMRAFQSASDTGPGSRRSIDAVYLKNGRRWMTAQATRR